MGELSPERAVPGALSDDGVHLNEEWAEFADWLASSTTLEDQQQAEALRALDTTAIDPHYLLQRKPLWEASALP